MGVRDWLSHSYDMKGVSEMDAAIPQKSFLFFLSATVSWMGRYGRYVYIAMDSIIGVSAVCISHIDLLRRGALFSFQGIGYRLINVDSIQLLLCLILPFILSSHSA